MITALTIDDLPDLAEALVRDDVVGELDYPEEVDPQFFCQYWGRLISGGHSLSQIARSSSGRVTGWILALKGYDFISGASLGVVQFWYVRHPRSLGSGIAAMGLLETFLDVARRAECKRVYGGEWAKGPELALLLKRRGFRHMETHYHMEL
jgi:hypothetical protein